MCSAYHKGRLKIVYDPNWIATDEYNTNYIHLVDIAEENDFTISVTNGQDTTLLTHHLPGTDSVTQLYSTTRYTSKEEGNGIVGVTVQNELTVPNSIATTNVNVNVFVSAGEDFEVFAPDDYYAQFVFKPQMGTIDQVPTDVVAAVDLDKPDCQDPTEIMDTPDPLTNVHKVFTGEVIKSFRPLLKRYNLHTAVGASVATNVTLRYRFAMFPYLRGNVANAIHSRVGPAPYNFANTVLLHWVTMMHSGWRGSIRYKMIPRGSRNYTTRMFNWMVQRLQYPAGLAQYATQQGGWIGFTNQSNLCQSVVYNNASFTVPFHGHNGTAVAVGDINPALEFEIPYYSDKRFVPGRKEDYTGTVTSVDHRIPCYELLWFYLGDVNTLADVYVAAGEDFQTYFFTGMPPLYFESAPPAAIP